MRKKAQASIEFTIAFVCTILFLIFTCNLFVWLNHCLVRRHVAYENTRELAGRGVGNRDGLPAIPGHGSRTEAPNIGGFYTPPELKIFKSGGY